MQLLMPNWGVASFTQALGDEIFTFAMYECLSGTLYANIQ